MYPARSAAVVARYFGRRRMFAFLVIACFLISLLPDFAFFHIISLAFVFLFFWGYRDVIFP